MSPEAPLGGTFGVDVAGYVKLGADFVVDTIGNRKWTGATGLGDKLDQIERMNLPPAEKEKRQKAAIEGLLAECSEKVLTEWMNEELMDHTGHAPMPEGVKALLKDLGANALRVGFDFLTRKLIEPYKPQERLALPVRNRPSSSLRSRAAKTCRALRKDDHATEICPGAYEQVMRSSSPCASKKRRASESGNWKMLWPPPESASSSTMPATAAANSSSETQSHSVVKSAPVDWRITAPSGEPSPSRDFERW